MSPHFEHIPVMKERSLELLAPALDTPGALLVDATLGLGGHAEAFLDAFPTLRLLGIDRDTEARDHARARLAHFGPRVTLVHARYDELGVALDAHFPGESPRGFLFDLGVSSLHLDKPERGFSYSVDAPLDMRMNTEEPLTAEGILSSYTAEALGELFYRLGDEKLANRYARAIVKRREETPLRRTGELVSVLQEATPYALKDRGHPAKRVFQALRMEVNRELDSLARALPLALDRLAPGGRAVVMSYHSGEDKLVKREIRRRSVSQAPLGLPEELPEHRSQLIELTRGAEKASEEEIAANPRSASVRVRAAEKRNEARV
jgi:16S rRNA (cytosine1402-N4)-methyltransferase